MNSRIRSRIIEHLQIFKIFGLMPLQLERPNLSRISQTGLAISILLSCLNLIFHYSPFIVYASGSVTYIGMFILKVYYSLYFAIFTYLLIKKRFLFARALHNLMKAQLKLGIKEYRIFSPIKSMIILTWVIFSISLVTRVVKLQAHGDFSDFIFGLYEITAWGVFYWFVFSVVCQFTYLILCVGACYSRLGSIPLSMLRIRNSKSSVRNYVKMYDTLTGISQTFTDCYDCLIAGNLLSSFYSSLDFCILVLHKTNDVEANWAESEPLIWLMYLVLQAVHIIYCCQSVINKVDL